ncbi:type II toxin-antitoxin system VapB family antitoxin [Rhizobium sp. S152]|uniref:type II toxin-antitoxin system VapB family antitoxin n=1 Tax=Rhizobium sp. S152 TaxID=3055038 RepID=UPI0025A99815|nr:type II toxin-antitoxin system VapB family antitoxin [Rhizobium sp. S152]MDM9627130.1 type II toxin-antitoxin system VapB family antitoxin [Rhizobium sp. S152]
MALYINNDDVEELAEKLATSRKQSKAEVIRQALLHEIERDKDDESLVERGLAYGRALRARAGEDRGPPADKAFIDSLYED